ncbi:MAG: MFS transporter [Reyranellaceae bacterium]
MSDIARPGRGLFYGWVVVASTFMVLCVGFGVAYAFNAFFLPLQQAYGATRGETSLVFSIAGFLYFALGAVSGPLADRWGPRPVVAAGVLVTAAGLALASQAQTLWQIYAAYGLGVGIGVGFAYVPAIAAVQKWFVRKRGLASGLAVSGIGVGTLVLPPLAALIVADMGWRAAYLALAVIMLAAGAVAALLLDDQPELRGVGPDGLPPQPAAAAPTASSRSFTFGAAIRSRPFWTLYIACSFAGLALFVPFVHLTPYATDNGVDAKTAVLLISIIGIGSIFGRFAFGGIADRFGRRIGLALMFSGLTAMMLWWSISTVAWALMLFAVLFGAFYGGFVALIPAMTADYFGVRHVSSIIGVLYTSVAFGTLFGPTVAGYAFDLTGSYHFAILGSAAMMFVGVAFILLAPQPQKWRQRQP